MALKQRRGTSSEWTTANPVLADGELGYEKDTNKMKVGNGADAWAVLPYLVSDPDPDLVTAFRNARQD